MKSESKRASQPPLQNDVSIEEKDLTLKHLLLFILNRSIWFNSGCVLSKLIYLQSLSGAFQAFALKGVVRAERKKVFHLTTNAAATARKIYCKENSQRRDLYPNVSFTFWYCKTLPFIFKLSKRVIALYLLFNSSVSQAESEKHRQHVNNADQKVFANPKSFFKSDFFAYP